MKILSKIKGLSKKKKIVAGGLAAVLVVTCLGALNGHAAQSVDTALVTRGTLEQKVELNGFVETDNILKYYSQIDGKIGSINVKKGDFVKKGDVLMTYDEENLDYNIAMADLNAQSQLGSYNNSIQTSGRTAGLYSEANRNLSVLDQQITDTQAAVTQLQKDINSKKAALADEGAKLQVSLIDWADRPDSEEYENLSKLVQTNAYEQQYNSDLVAMQDELNRLNLQLNACKEYKAEMTSQKASTQMSLMTSGAKEQLEADKAANELASSDKHNRYENAKNGIVAEFDGVVTGIDAVKGSNVANGSLLLTLESSKDIVIRFSVSKYDIENIEEGQSATVKIKNKEYTGKVDRIDRMTSRDAGQTSNVGMEIKLDAPDDDIILGLEAKAVIDTVSIDNVLQIPKGAVYSDTNGEYVYVLRDKKAVKVDVEVGAYNSEMIEIVSGLNESDTVIIAGETEITEGMELEANKSEDK
ncbi:MAG: efflux RND transporter periplasmic adaptor subunit [Lachnospiraceae bacterium]|nr:efflux RND transporter periplasmic adaptor subunit [Lachnospiraceae bacterium]